MKAKHQQSRISDYIILVVIALIVFFAPNVVAFIKLNYFSTLLSIHELASIDVDSEVPISAFAVTKGIACSTADQLNLYSYDGKLNYQRQLFGKKTVVRAAGDTIVVADLERGEIAKLSSKLEIVNKKRDIGQLIDLIATSKGDIVCQMAEANTIKIFDADLNQKAVITVPTDKLIEMAISEDESTILVSAVAIEDLKFKSYALQYDMSGMPLATSDLEGDLIFNTYTMNNQVIVTQSKIKSYNKESQKVAEILNMEKIDQTASYKQFLYTSYIQDDDGVSQPYLSIYSDDLSYHQKLKLNVLPEHIVVNDKFIITYAAGKIYVYDHSLRSLKSIQTNRDIVDIQWLDASRLMAYDQNHINVYVLE